MRFMRLASVLFVVISTSALTTFQETISRPRVAFEIVPVRTAYRPNEPITLRLILVNRGEASVTVEKFSPTCSSDFFAFAQVSVVDEHHQQALKGGCAADSFLSKDAVEREASQVGKTDYWIKLEQGELFGQETTREVTTKKGTYTIKAYLLPARFPEEERRKITQRGIAILSGEIEAPAVRITVR